MPQSGVPLFTNAIKTIKNQINTIANQINNTTKDDVVDMVGGFCTSEFAVGLLGVSMLIGIPVYS